MAKKKFDTIYSALPKGWFKKVLCYLKDIADNSASSAPDYSTLLQSIVDNTGTTNTLLNGMQLSLGDILVQLQAINTNTINQEARLNSLIALMTANNISLADILLELQTILVEVENIDDNTDDIETHLQTIITTLTSILNERHIDLEITEANKVCFDDGGVITEYLVRQRIEFDSESGTDINNVTQYSSDGGITWNTTVPTGVQVACTTSSISYNEPGIEEVTSSITYTTNNFNSLTAVVIEDINSITVNGNTISNVPAGYSVTWIASELLSQDIIIDGTGGRVIVNYIK